MRVLITGRNGYIGVKTSKWLFSHDGEFEVDFLDMRSESWKQFDMKDYDSVINAVGIAHVDSDDQKLYERVNTEYAYECAKIAKACGVKQFIQISSVYVYAAKGGLKEENRVSPDMPECPGNYYGESKLKADRLIGELEDENFKVVIIRTPMVYGPGAKGNYNRLSKLAVKVPVFPDIKNQRSMIFVDNLTEFIRLLLINKESGIFYPQNTEYVNTTDMVKTIAECNNTKIRTIKVFNPLINALSGGRGKLSTTISKLFGNYMIDKQMSEYKENYNVVDFYTSIKLTEQGKGIL
ncbi:MAG: NAD-dependent epimerase/dehydratase family protein [Lachnospiraceae bacterium]|nr:NAD-dependent epimerase/dehydratase family protein [Lachnospiraceae bacterium]